MKVLLISPLPPPNGGIASWTVQYLEYAKAMPLDVHLINNNVVGSRVENLSNRYVLKDELKRYTKIRSQLKKELKTFKPDIIHYNIPCSPKGIIRDYLLMKSIGSRSKTAVHLRCTPEDQLKGSRIGLYFFKKVVRLADAVMTLNTPTVDFIQKLTGKKAAATANFISEDDIKSDALHINGKIREAVYAGHITKAKGIDELLAAAEELPCIHFTLIGNISADYSNRPVPGNVQFMNDMDRSQVLKRIEQSDVFVFPSYTEGFSNSLLEAMAKGLPCIASGAGANRDMLENGGGVIIPVKDKDSIVDAFHKIQDPRTRRGMAHWNIEKVKSEYTVEKVMQSLVGIYNKTIHHGERQEGFANLAGKEKLE